MKGKSIIFCYIAAVVVCLAVWGLCVQTQAERKGSKKILTQANDGPRLSEAQLEELRRLRFYYDNWASLGWRAGVSKAMLKKANWLANRLNLPIKRPITVMDLQSTGIPDPWMDVVVRPAPTWLTPFLDTIYWTNLYNTNISLKSRLAAIHFWMQGILETSDYEFNFQDGQLSWMMRLTPFGDEERMRQIKSSPTLEAQMYQLATNWLAAVDVNLDMLEKSRLPHPVHEGEATPPGETVSVPVYYVEWGKNYYGLSYVHKFWHTNEVDPAVEVEITATKELVELTVDDMAYYRNPPTLITNAWQLAHAPNPPYEQLIKPAVAEDFCLSPPLLKYYTNVYYYYPSLRPLTNTARWQWEHHGQPGSYPAFWVWYSNDLNWVHEATNSGVSLPPF